MNHPELTPEVHFIEQKKKHEFESEFIFKSATAKRVRLAGTFNEWQPALELKKSGQDYWSLKLTLPIIDGEDRYVFKFVVDDNNWLVSNDHKKARDSSGNENTAVLSIIKDLTPLCLPFCNYIEVPRVEDLSMKVMQQTIQPP